MPGRAITPFNSYPLRRAAAGFCTLLFVLFETPSSLANEDEFAPFFIPIEEADTIVLRGELDEHAATKFRRVQDAYPHIRKLRLISPGGLVHVALLIAEDVHRLRFAAEIPADSECSSACSFIFLASHQRLSAGRLGVHQLYGLADISSMQHTLSDVVELLDKYGAPSELVAKMLRTPSETMHYYSPEDLEKMGLLFHRQPESMQGEKYINRPPENKYLEAVPPRRVQTKKLPPPPSGLY